jgi:hypothetical protein
MGSLQSNLDRAFGIHTGLNAAADLLTAFFEETRILLELLGAQAEVFYSFLEALFFFLYFGRCHIAHDCLVLQADCHFPGVAFSTSAAPFTATPGKKSPII